VRTVSKYDRTTFLSLQRNFPTFLELNSFFFELLIPHLVEFLIPPSLFRIFSVIFLSSELFFAVKKVILDFLELFYSRN
jgi:hypothetical protein